MKGGIKIAGNAVVFITAKVKAILANITYRAVGSEDSTASLNISVRDLTDYYNYTQISRAITNGTLTITPASASSNTSKCIIATAAYGTPLHEDIDVLIEFRDEHLMTNRCGGAGNL